MFATLKEAKESSIINVSGLCADSPAFIQYVNDATRRLMRRGGWSGLEIPIQVCSRGGCVVFERYVGQVRRLNVCNAPTEIRNRWAPFSMYDQMRYGCHWQHNWFGQEYRMINSNATPVFQDIMGDNRTVRFYARCAVDYNKFVTVFGRDNNNQTLMTNNQDGTFSQGVKVELLAPFGSTSTFVRHIDRLLIDDLQCPLDAYAYNADTDLLEDIGHYQPGETNPSYTRYTLNIPRCGNTVAQTGSCGNTVPLVALVKLKFIPVVVDNDLVLISNLDALKLQIQAIKFEEANNTQLATEYEVRALRELNIELRDDFPDDQIPVSFGEMAGLDIGRQRCF